MKCEVCDTAKSVDIRIDLEGDDEPGLVCSWECAAVYALGCSSGGAPGEVNGVSAEEEIPRYDATADAARSWLQFWDQWKSGELAAVYSEERP